VKVKHISYSAVKESVNCPFRFKLLYVDRVRPSIGNEFTTFGNAIHSVLEEKVVDDSAKEDWNSYFEEKFIEHLQKAKKNGAKSFDPKLVTPMRQQGKDILPEVIPALKEYFGDYDVVDTETQLYEDYKDDISFKGFIDLVIRTEDGKVHVIDHKTCTFGWPGRKKGDKMVVYQAVLYKYFLAQRLDLDMKDIECYYVLLKRTAKKGKKVEIFKVTSGPKRTENALEVVDQTISYVKQNKYLKNKTFCSKCDFFNTKHCKR